MGQTVLRRPRVERGRRRTQRGGGGGLGQGRGGWQARGNRAVPPPDLLEGRGVGAYVYKALLVREATAVAPC